MPAHLLDEVLMSPASWDAGEKRESMLAALKEELACLRFSVLLTAKWERSGVGDAERRKELRAELASLRRGYSEKIDEIAMAFSVQDAMEAQAEVERTITLPLSTPPSPMLNEYDQLRF